MRSLGVPRLAWQRHGSRQKETGSKQRILDVARARSRPTSPENNSKSWLPFSPGSQPARVVNAEDLRFFLAVREAGSIKGGARALKVDHSTVSRRIAALEEALDAHLFDRTPEGLVETDVARAVAPVAERIEILTRELEDAAALASDAPRGPVCIAVFPV